MTVNADNEHAANVTSMSTTPRGVILKRVYSNTQVKKAIDQLNDNKCCYCGVTLNLDVQRDIEHFRPSMAVHYSKTLKFTTGYYWLTAEWENLFPSCHPCNGLKKRENFHINGLKAIPRSMGKKNHFPLDNNPTTAPHHGNSLTTETPLLFNPCERDPKLLFDYVLNHNGDYPILYIKPKKSLSVLDNKIAQTSIEILGLNRMLLCTERAKALKSVKSDTEMLIKLLKQADTKLISDHIGYLVLYLDPSIPSSNFVGMLWQECFIELKLAAEMINQYEKNLIPINNDADILKIFKDYRAKYRNSNNKKIITTYKSKNNTLNL